MELANMIGVSPRVSTAMTGIAMGATGIGAAALAAGAALGLLGQAMASAEARAQAMARAAMDSVRNIVGLSQAIDEFYQKHGGQGRLLIEPEAAGDVTAMMRAGILGQDKAQELYAESEAAGLSPEARLAYAQAVGTGTLPDGWTAQDFGRAYGRGTAKVGEFTPEQRGSVSAQQVEIEAANLERSIGAARDPESWLRDVAGQKGGQYLEAVEKGLDQNIDVNYSPLDWVGRKWHTWDWRESADFRLATEAAGVSFNPYAQGDQPRITFNKPVAQEIHNHYSDGRGPSLGGGVRGGMDE
jgi:hypothetical protein